MATLGCSESFNQESFNHIIQGNWNSYGVLSSSEGAIYSKYSVDYVISHDYSYSDVTETRLFLASDNRLLASYRTEEKGRIEIISDELAFVVNEIFLLEFESNHQLITKEATENILQNTLGEREFHKVIHFNDKEINLKTNGSGEEIRLTRM